MITSDEMQTQEAQPDNSLHRLEDLGIRSNRKMASYPKTQHEPSFQEIGDKTWQNLLAMIKHYHCNDCMHVHSRCTKA